jgi:serine phosphatase RsbU (regulator of sigma subunit)
MFGSQRLKNLFAAYSLEDGGLIDRLLQELQDFTGEAQDQEDDITIVEVKRYNNAAEI